MTKKGILALAGVAVIGADVFVFVHDGGAFSWKSVKLGYALASGNAKDIIKSVSESGPDNPGSA